MRVLELFFRIAFDVNQEEENYQSYECSTFACIFEEILEIGRKSVK